MKTLFEIQATRRAYYLANRDKIIRRTIESRRADPLRWSKRKEYDRKRHRRRYSDPVDRLAILERNHLNAQVALAAKGRVRKVPISDIATSLGVSLKQCRLWRVRGMPRDIDGARLWVGNLKSNKCWHAQFNRVDGRHWQDVAAELTSQSRGAVNSHVQTKQAPRFLPCYLIWNAWRRKHKADTTANNRRAYSRERWRANRERLNAYTRALRAKKAGHYRALARSYRKNPAQAIKQKEWHAKQKSNPIYILKRNLRSRFKKVLKFQSVPPWLRGWSDEMLGCTPEFLKAWLESHFITWMSWDNYGTAWHIDHTFPLSRFDLMKTEEQRRAMHYTNLKPMWARSNMRKQAKVMRPHQPSLLLTIR